MKPNNSKSIIYIASPWGPAGGGMYRVADYLIQTHAKKETNFELLGLDTRGNKTAVHSLWYLLRSLLMILRGRLNGTLVGVHVNMAERLSVFRKGVLILFCKLIGVPTVLHLHAAQFPIFYNSIPRFFRLLVRGVFRLPKKVIVLGGAAKKFVGEKLLVPDERIEIVANGVPAPISLRRKFDGTKIFEMLFLGNLTERKGVTDLLRAIKQMTLHGDGNFLLRLAGGGNVDYYKKFVSENQLEDIVHFEGWVDQQQASVLLANADVLILPSYDEGLPLVILEAMGNGVAVICTPVGEIANFLKDEVNAIFVTPGDVDGIGNAILRLQSDHTLRENIELTNLAHYDEFFSVEKFYQAMVNNYVQAFNSRLLKH